MTQEDARRYSPVFERNREPVVEVLRRLPVVPGARVLEVGSGSGEHVCYFAQQLPEHVWQPTEQQENVASIEAWRRELGVEEQVLAPVAIDLLQANWDARLPGGYGLVMSMNVVHIVAWQGVLHLLAGAARQLDAGGVLYLYGPYRSERWEVEPSNAQFDAYIQKTYPGGGLRMIERVVEEAQQVGLTWEGEEAMPANNRSLWFCKR